MIASSGSILRQGISTQIRNDHSDLIMGIMRYVLREHRGARWLDAGLRAMRPTRVPEYFAVANGARCFLRMRPVGPAGGVLACARRDNERRAVAQLRQTVPDIPWSDIAFDLGGAIAALRAPDTSPLPHLRRAAALAHELRARHDLFHTVRAMELVFYYDRLGRILDQGRYRAVVMSSFTNPWGIALNMAARRRGIPVVHVMHGVPVSPVPRLDYDLMIATNQASYETLRDAGCNIGRVIVKSGQAKHHPVISSPATRRAVVALCLSKEPRQERVIEWIRGLLCNDEVESVLVRPHPANPWRGLASAISDFPTQRVRLSLPGDDADFGAADLIVAGNTSMHLDALAAGKPTVYVADLDHSDGRALSFVNDGLLCQVDDPRQLSLPEVQRFHDRTAWQSAFRRHVNIDQSRVEVEQEIREAFAELLGRVT